MKKRMLSIFVSLVLVLTGMNINIDKVDAASKDPNYEYMTFLIMGRFTAYPTQSGSSLQATWNSGSGARTNPVNLGQKVDIHVGSGDGASPNLIPAEDVSKWQIEYVGEYDNAPYGFDWGVDNNYHQYDDWLEDHNTFKDNYLNYSPNDLNFKNYSLDKNGNIVFDLSMTLNQRGDKAYNYFSKLRYEYEPPSILWDYWGGKSELQNSDPLFAKEVQRALDNYNKTDWDGYIFPYPFVVVLKRPIAAEGITYEGYFLENGAQLRPYEDTKHTLDVPVEFVADDIAGYELVGSKQQYETAPTGTIKKGVSSYNITWKKILNGFNFRKNYIHYYYKPKDNDPGSDTPPPKFTYTSVPKSYGEIKQGTYSADRNSEKWNAMAGFAHDSTLFMDVGASYMSVDLATDIKWAETDNSSPSSHDVNGSGTHNTRGCEDGCGGSYCINGGCPNSGNDCSPCSGHRVQDGIGADGKPTYTTEYRDHRHGRCGTSTEQWIESFPVLEDFTVKAHQIGSYDVKTPMELNANVPYVQEDINLSQNSKVTVTENNATFDEIKGLTKSIPTLKCYQENIFRSQANEKIKAEYMANKSHFYYNPPRFAAEGLGESMEFLNQTKAKFVQQNTEFDGTLSYKPEYLNVKWHNITTVTCTFCKGKYCSTCGPNHSLDYGTTVENFCKSYHNLDVGGRGCSCGSRSYSCKQSCLDRGRCYGHSYSHSRDCDERGGEYYCYIPCETKITEIGSKCTIDYGAFVHGGEEGKYNYWEIINNANMYKYKTNFLPKVENWSRSNQVNIVGYNGDYNSSSRRGGDRELFYKEGLKLVINQINNGKKETGAFNLKFVTTDSRGKDAFAIGDAAAIYCDGDDKVNDVIVHSPISISKLEIIPLNALIDQRVPSQQGQLQILNPDTEFSVVFHTTWTGSEMITTPAISQITEKTGKGYKYGLETNPWIKSKGISFPFSVIFKDDNIRYEANTIINLDKNKSIYNFYIPVSEKEQKASDVRGYIEATNNLNQSVNEKTWMQLNEKRYTDFSKGVDYAADHIAKKNEKLDVVGRIGNFEFSYTDDPTYQNFFLQPDLSNPKIKGLWFENKKPEAWNKYIGPYADLYQRATKGQDTTGLDKWDAIPRLKQKPSDFWPLQGDNNKNNIKGLEINIMNSKLVKLGYSQWFSLQSVGNYDGNAQVTIYPKYKILNTKTGQIKEVGSVFVNDGGKYLQTYPFDKQADQGKVVSKIITRLNTKLRFIEGNEQIRTNMVDNISLTNDKNLNIGNMSKIILDKYARTFIGGFKTDKGTKNEVNVQHGQANEGGDSNKAHAKQAQRWHASLWLPSSSVFLEPNKTFKTLEDLIDTKEDSVLLVSFDVGVGKGEGPWDLQTTSETLGGYTKNSELRIYDKDDNKYIKTIVLPMGTIAAFDLSDRSYEDVTISGIH